MTDDQIMEQVKTGNIEALQKIFDRYSGKIFNYFMKMTFDNTLSEDLTQDVFEKVILSRNNYKVQSAFPAWIFRIARNRLMDHFRNNKETLGLAVVRSTSMKSEAMEEQDVEKKQKLRKSMEQLKKEHKEILILTRFNNLDYKETAQVLGITETAVKSRVFRAMKSLRKIYFDERP